MNKKSKQIIYRQYLFLFS